MSGTGSVGARGVYEAGDQRNYKDQDVVDKDRYNEGKPHSHVPNDSKDQRSIANRLAREERRHQELDEKDLDKQRMDRDATLPAKAHGNQPSRGAEIDQELREEEEATLRKKNKGPFGPK